MTRPVVALEPHDAALPVVVGRHTLTSVGDRVLDLVQARPGRTSSGWLWLLTGALALLLLLAAVVVMLVREGVGVWGINHPVAWGFAIINFVWWIGIGHAGTLISAILLLMRQPWRTSVNRVAEAMTLFAVLCAALFPLLHLGRPERFYWILPYPSTMGVWPQWRSPLVWDVFAVGTYGAVSLIFWYLGLLPDLASLRDRARRLWVRRVAGVLSLGWINSARHWQRHQALYLLLAALATPLVISVHSVVSTDFTVAIVPGWNSTIFPPYFVAGAIFSGLAMVLTIILPARAVFGLRDLITARHLDAMGTLMLVAGLIVAYGYVVEGFFGWYSGEPAEMQAMADRWFGPWRASFWPMLACNVLAPQLLWFPSVRRRAAPLFVISQLVNVGMWLERYVIIVTSLQRDHMPSAWGKFHPTPWDLATFLGTVGLFATLLLLFFRFVPMLSIHELRELLHERGLVAPEPAAAVAVALPPPPAPLRSSRLHGLVAEFDRPEALVEAARLAREAGFTRVEAYAPWPVRGLARALGFRSRGVPRIMLAGGLTGAGLGYLLQWYTATIDYPWDIGGRWLHSWPAFVPVTFELMILGGALSGVVGMLVLNGLPRLHHPMFGAPGFERGSRDRFFLCLERDGDGFDATRAWRFLAARGPLRVSEVAT